MATRRRGVLTSIAGMTLAEVVVVLGVLSVIAAAVAPMAIEQVQYDHDAETRQQLFEIYRGLLGDPARQTFGYVGDVGDLPSSLNDLLAKPAGLPAYTTAAHTSGIGMGWRGPYVDRGFFSGDEFKDAWGQPLEYGGKTGAGGGRTARGQTRSAGPDGVLGTTDDIVFPLAPVVTDATLLVTVHVIESVKQPQVQQFIPNALLAEVQLLKTVDGAEVVQETQSTPGLSEQAQPRRGFSFVTHHGPHALRVRHYKDDARKLDELVQSFVVVTVRAQTQVLVEPHITHPGVNIKSF